MPLKGPILSSKMYLLEGLPCPYVFIQIQCTHPSIPLACHLATEGEKRFVSKEHSTGLNMGGRSPIIVGMIPYHFTTKQSPIPVEIHFCSNHAIINTVIQGSNSLAELYSGHSLTP